MQLDDGVATFVADFDRKFGAPVPDIGTEEKFKQLLLSAPSIAYSASASGTYYETQMLKKLGIEAQVLPKSKKVVGDRVGTIVARGDAAVGMQQVSELLPIPGITYVGRLPESVQSYTVDTPAMNHRGPKRIVVGGGTETDPEVWYYSDDHYESFCLIPDAED